MGSVQVRKLGYALGAEVTGVDLTQPLDDATFAAIKAAWLENLVVCFPRQQLTKDQFTTFAGRFGDVDHNRKAKKPDPDHPAILLVTNKPVDGKEFDGYKQGQSWHSDRSYHLNPTPATFLLAKEVPEAGGDTMFANQYMAFERLSPAMQHIVEGLHAVHDNDLIKGASMQGEAVAAARRVAFPPVLHPVVRVHPETGRKALYVGERVSHFDAMTPEESAPLLAFLNRQAVAYEITYRHHWNADDLVMWDNRCLMHVALSDYDLRHDIRHIWRCSLHGPVTGTVYDPDGSRAAAAVTT